MRARALLGRGSSPIGLRSGRASRKRAGVKLDRAERRKIMALVLARHIDATLVTELSHGVWSTMGLLATIRELEARRVLVIAPNHMAFDLSTPHGRMIAIVLAGIAEFERGLIQEHIRSGIAAAMPEASGTATSPGSGQNPTALHPR
jgi:putative DNA-invertase from lambdoid prophage Rac